MIKFHIENKLLQLPCTEAVREIWTWIKTSHRVRCDPQSHRRSSPDCSAASGDAVSRGREFVVLAPPIACASRRQTPLARRGLVVDRRDLSARIKTAMVLIGSVEGAVKHLRV